MGIDAAAAIAMTRSVGHLLRQLRLGRGETQEQVGLRAGIGNSDVCRLERGSREPRLGALLRVCGSVQVRPSVLLRLAEDEAFPIEPQPWSADMAWLLRRLGALVGGDVPGQR